MQGFYFTKGVIMARKKVKLTKLQKAYQKEQRRLQRYQRRAEKKGYTFSKSLVPETPQRITKKLLEEIKQIRPRKIRNEDIYIDTSTGEVLSEFKKEQSEYLPTIDYVTAVEQLIKALPDMRYTKQGATEISPMKSSMYSALYDTLAEYGEQYQYDEYLATVYGEIQDGLTAIELSSDQSTIYSNFSTALSLIKGKPLTMQEAMDISDYSELIGSVD